MYPLLKDKKFTDLNSGKTVTVIDQFDDVAILDSDHRINITRLLDKSYYDEFIDPKSFFNDSAYNILSDKIKSIPNDVLDKLSDNDSAIINTDDGYERRELQKKLDSINNNLNSGAQKQFDLLKDIIDDEDLPPNINLNNQNIEEPVTSVVVNRDNPIQVDRPKSPVMSDPIITMFEGVKRNTDLSFSLTINNKIPRIDFIEMMEDSYETSIIEFLADEFTNKILSNPSMIKSKIIDEIKKLVYPEKEKIIEMIYDRPSTPLTKKPSPPKSKIIKEGKDPIDVKKSKIKA